MMSSRSTLQASVFRYSYSGSHFLFTVQICLDIPYFDKPELTIDRTISWRRNSARRLNCAILHRNSRYTGHISCSWPVRYIETYLYWSSFGSSLDISAPSLWCHQGALYRHTFQVFIFRWSFLVYCIYLHLWYLHRHTCSGSSYLTLYGVLAKAKTLVTAELLPMV